MLWTLLNKVSTLDAATTLGAIVERNERRIPNDLCLVFETQRLSFREYAERVRRLADGLRKLGLNRQDRVSIISTNRAECFELYGASEWAGYINAPISAALAVPEIVNILNDTRPRIVLFEDAFAESVKTIRKSAAGSMEFVCLNSGPRWAIPYAELITAGGSDGPPFRAKEGDYLSIFYTSGTTGQHKGVVLSHRQQMSSGNGTASEAGLSVGDKALLTMPCSHLAAATHRIAFQLRGGAVIIGRRSDPTEMLQTIERERISFVGVTPTLLSMILGVPDFDKYDLSSIKTVLYSAAPMPVDLLERGIRSLGRVFVSYYGQTEGGATRLLRHHHRLDGSRASNERLKSVGLPRPGTKLRIVDDNEREVPCLAVGEICVQSDSVMAGYWNNSAATAETLRGGWLHTGDLGYVDHDGFLFLVDRKKDMIISGGNNIYSKEVEDALLKHPETLEAAVIGVPDALLGEAVRAIIIRRAGAAATEKEIIAACRTQIAHYKCPTSIVFVDALPKTATGKIQKPTLRERYGKTIAARSSSPAGPRTKIEEILLELWQQALDRQDIGCDDDFFLLGGDSISALSLFHRVEEELQYQLPLTILTEAPTISQLAHRLETNTLGAIDNAIRIHPSGSQRPLFAIHGGGGHALGLLPVLRSLGPDQPCYGLQPPEMDWPGHGCETLPQIAAHYIGEVHAVQPHGPYRLLGISFGGVVAFEMALQWQKRGETVECLTMVDTVPPTCKFGDSISIYPRSTLGPTPPPHTEIERRCVEVRQSHFDMLRNHVLDSRMEDCIFHGELIYAYCAGSPVTARQDRRQLWQQFASRTRLIQLPGSHGTQDRDPQFSALKDLLEACLSGSPPEGIDPARVFDLSYGLENRNGREYVVSSNGEVYRVAGEPQRGCVNDVRIDKENISVAGWALEPCGQQPAQVIAVFLEGHFLGHGASGEPRVDIARQPAAVSVPYSGFSFTLPHAMATGTIGRPRVFVLSQDGSATELHGIGQPATIASCWKFSSGETSGAILSGDWSVRERWGVWSEGHHAALAFDADALPECFTVEIDCMLFPPGPLPRQTVRISDDSGTVLGVMSNEQPNGGVTLKIDRSSNPSRRFASLNFYIENPISPRDAMMSTDTRKLGIGLKSIMFHA